MLSEPIRRAFLRKIEAAKEHMADYDPPSRLYALEARYTLFQIERILTRPDRARIEEELVSFFQERWARVRSSDCQYLNDFISPANHVCIDIAKELGRVLSKPYLALIMPTLTWFPSSTYTTSSYDEDLNLKEIILSDCKQRIISLPDVLDSAQVDGVLKHNYLSGRLPTKLSQSEQDRFLSRHPSVKAAYEALQARIAYKLHGETVGAALNRLVQGLREGGENIYAYGDARRLVASYDAGKNANTAIIAFQAYLESLDKNTRMTLLRAKSPERFAERGSISVTTLWSRLARPVDVAYREGGTYCVEMIASQLEEILKDNPDLYDTVSYEGDAAASLSALDIDVMHTGQAMSRGLATITHQRCYASSGNHALYLSLLRDLDPRQGFILKVGDIACIADRYAPLRSLGSTSATRLSESILIYVKKNYDPRNIILALDGMTVEGKEQFLRVTGFRIPVLSAEPAPRVRFFAEAKTLKRTAGTAELAVSSARETRGVMGGGSGGEAAGAAPSEDLPPPRRRMRV